MNNIQKNQYQCPRCKEILTSKHEHDMQTCSCGALAIDGGENLRIIEVDATVFTKKMEQVKLKEIRYMDVFRFSEYESNCLKMAFRADNKIAFISISKTVYYADENTLVYRSDDPYTNPKFRTIPSPKK